MRRVIIFFVLITAVSAPILILGGKSGGDSTIFENKAVECIVVFNHFSGETACIEDVQSIGQIMERLCTIRKGKEIPMPPPGSTSLSICVRYADGTEIKCGNDAFFDRDKVYAIHFPNALSWEYFLDQCVG